MKIVLALDPTSNNIGTALFVDGTLKSVSCLSGDPLKGLTDMLKEMSVLPDVIVYEESRGAKSYRAAESLSKSRGWIEGVCAALDIERYPVTPEQVKEAATGRKRLVSKHEMIAAAETLYPGALSRKDNGEIHLGKAEHEADAIFVHVAYQLLTRWVTK